MNALKRNNVVIRGKGTNVMLFAHGFGCDQSMWRFVAPAFEDAYQTVLFDHVGAGGSDLSTYSKEKYSNLKAYTQDIIEIIRALAVEKVVFVGHSVSAMMGAMAAKEAPELFKALILVSPSPSFINDGDYTGGFTRPQIDELLETLESNHMGWSMTMAPVIMGEENGTELVGELSGSFCRMNPDIARQFARVTFLEDTRPVLKEVSVHSLILQSKYDAIAPVSVGEYVQAQMPDSQLVVLDTIGHCPHLSAPEQTVAVIKGFLQ